MSHNPFDEDFDQDVFLEDEDDFEVDLGAADESGGRLPAVDYPMHVVDVVKKISKSSDNPMFEWTFQISDGDAKGREFKTWTVLTASGLWKLAELLEALGVAKRGEKAKFAKSEVLGLCCLGKLKDDTYEGRKVSRLATLKPHPEGNQYAIKLGVATPF